MAHEWWRVFVSDSGVPGNGMLINTLRMFDSAGTEITSGGTGTVSTSYFGTGWTELLNSNDTDYWATTGAAPFWAKYHFASAVDVAWVWIRPDNNSNAPTPMKVQYSDDDSTWTDAVSFTPSWTNILEYTHPGRAFGVDTPAADYYLSFRIRGTATSDSGAIKIAEIQLRETSGGTNLSNGNAADSETGGGYASGDNADAASSYGFKAFDSNSSTYWAGNLSGSASPLAWISYNFKLRRKITEFTVTNKGDGAGSPTGFVFEGSNDGGETWTALHTASGLSWTNGETKTFTVTYGGGGGSVRQPIMQVIC